MEKAKLPYTQLHTIFISIYFSEKGSIFQAHIKPVVCIIFFFIFYRVDYCLTFDGVKCTILECRKSQYHPANCIY